MAIADQLTRDALALSIEGRARLAQTLLTSLEPAEPGVEEAWEQEIARRLEKVEAGTAKGSPAEEVFSRIRARHST